MTKWPVQWNCFDSTVSLMLWSQLKLPLYDFSDLQSSWVFWESRWHRTSFNIFFSRCHKPYDARPILHESSKSSRAMMYILISAFAIMYLKKKVIKTRGPRGPWVAHLRKKSKATVEPIIENPKGIIWTTLVEDLLMM